MESLPAWARQLSEKYYSGAFSMFVLYGNIYDLVPYDSGQPPAKDEKRVSAVSLGKFLQTGMFGQRDIVVYCHIVQLSLSHSA